MASQILAAAWMSLVKHPLYKQKVSMSEFPLEHPSSLQAFEISILGAYGPSSSTRHRRKARKKTERKKETGLKKEKKRKKINLAIPGAFEPSSL